MKYPRDSYLNTREYFGFIRRQDSPLEQELDATVAFVKGEMWRILMKTDEFEELEKLRGFYKKEDGYVKARFSPDPGQANRFLIDEIFEEDGVQL